MTVKKVAKRRPWRELRWAGTIRYQCLSCNYSTFDPKAMAEHVAAKHQKEEVT
jgi:hypothetical protein